MTEITINNRDALLRDINDAMPLRKIADALDRMSLSADTKALLMDLAAVTVKAGEFVVNLGRKIELDRWGVAPVDQRAGDRRGLLAQLRIGDGVDDARGLLRLGDGWHGRIRGETVEFAVGTLHHIDALDG